MLDFILFVLFIGCIEIAERYFPNNEFVDCFICVIGVLYFARLLWQRIKKHSHKKNIH